VAQIIMLDSANNVNAIIKRMALSGDGPTEWH
jgi:hypothetical protein